MNSFLLQMNWRPGDSPDPGGQISIQVGASRLDLWADEEAGVQTAVEQDWLVLAAGFAVFRSLEQNQPPDLAAYCAGQLAGGRTLDDLLLDMEGAFVLAAWDQAGAALWLAGDRTGSRCLYYSVLDDGMVCASHPQRICKALGRAEMDLEGLSYYLGLKGIPAPWTPVIGVKKTRPGWSARFDGTRFEEKEYWKPLDRLDAAVHGTLDQAASGLLAELSGAIRQYTADPGGQPVGIFLSGGLDSTMLAFLAKQQGLELEAFTAGYAPTFRTDETQHAALVARRLKIPHKVCLLDARQMPALVSEEVSGFPEPLADPSFWPQVNLARQARGQVQAMLDGTGADSLLGGSSKFAVKKYADWYRRLPGVLRKSVIAPVSNLFPASRRSRLSNWIRLWQVFIRGCEVSDTEKTVFYSRFLHPAAANELLKDGCRLNRDLSGELLHAYYKQTPEDRAVAAAGYMTFKAVQPWVELMKLACIEQGGGFSVRKPFLYSPVIAYNLALPDSYKVRDGQGKLVQRRAAQGLVPDEILRRKKANFSPPVGRWLSGEMRGPFFEAFRSSSSPFDFKSVEKLYQQQDCFFRDWQSELWALYMWQVWWNALINEMGAGA